MRPNGKGFMRGPSIAVYSQKNARKRNTEMLSQISSASSNPIDGEYPIGSGISHLIRHGSPSAVIWGVIEVIVYSLNALMGFWNSHVIAKIFKAIPSFANPYASPSVIFKRWVIGIRASISHLCPRSVNLGPLSVFCKSMPCFVLGNEYSDHASAGFGCTRPKISDALQDNLAAVTNTRIQIFPISVGLNCGF